MSNVFTHTVTIRNKHTGLGRMVYARCTCGAASDLYRTIDTPHKWAAKHEQRTV